MRRRIPALVIATLFLLTTSVFALQNASPALKQLALKKIPSAEYPKAVLMSAQHLVQDGTMVHLSGSVEIRIFTSEKENLVIRGEDADYNAATGEVTSRGNSTAVIESTR
jgi:lipopolysaccharide assembly outer membrane protein LptD (OstA)